MAAPKSNLECVTCPSTDSGHTEFWLSDPEPMDESDGDWGFAIYADKGVFLATFTYASEAAARAARGAMVVPLKEAIFIATRKVE